MKSLKKNIPYIIIKDNPILGPYTEQLLEYPRLSKEEEIDTFNIMINNKSLDARDKLIKHNLFLVIVVAIDFLNRGLPIEDMVQEGNIGLINAICKFDPTRKPRFSTMAVYWIRQAIGRAIDSSTRLIYLPYSVINKRRICKKAITNHNLDSKDYDVIAEKTGLMLYQVKDCLATHKIVDINSPPPAHKSNGEPGLPLVDLIGGDGSCEIIDYLSRQERFSIAVRFPKGYYLFLTPVQLARRKFNAQPKRLLTHEERSLINARLAKSKYESGHVKSVAPPRKKLTREQKSIIHKKIAKDKKEKLGRYALVIT